MKRIILTISIIFGCLTFSNSQSNINDYKYVIVPNRFDFLKSEDQYQLNSLTKFLFNKYGFTAIMEDEVFLQDLVDNGCLALRAHVEKINGLFLTKLVVVLKDCNNKTIYTTKVGGSREKDFKKAYSLALRDAFKSFETVSYSYKPNKANVAQERKLKPAVSQEIEKLKEEIKTLKGQKTSSIKAPPKVEDKKIEIEEKIEDVSVGLVATTPKTKMSNVLYAQETGNGFQVVDSTPKIIMFLVKTPKQDVFLVKERSAIVYKEDGFWYLLENNKATTTTKKIIIKF
jgi:hypothetical protein